MIKMNVSDLVELQRLDQEISTVLKNAFEIEETSKPSEKTLLKKLDGMRKTRNHIMQTIDNIVVKRYERLRGNKTDTAAVVPVKNGVCQGCFIEVSTATYAEIQRKDVAASCDHCGRYIYFAEAAAV